MTARAWHHLVLRGEHESALRTGTTAKGACGQWIKPLPEWQARQLPLCPDCDKATRGPGWTLRALKEAS